MNVISNGVNATVGLVEFAIIAIIWLFALTGGMAIIVSLLPRDNPLRNLLTAITKRLAVTLSLYTIAIIFEWVPLLDVLLDLVAVVGSTWYWFRLLGDVRTLFRAPEPPQARPSSFNPVSPALPAPSPSQLRTALDTSPAVRP